MSAVERIDVWCEIAVADPERPDMVDFDVIETALLADGSRVSLRTRGWSVGASDGLRQTVLENLDREWIENGVRMTLLPDEDDDTIDDFRVELLDALGIAVTVGELESVPTYLSLGPDVTALIGEPSAN